MNIVLFEPNIPQNTGSIARSCAGTDTKLILCGKLGFSLEDRYLKRAGLDYWEHVNLEVVPDFKTLQLNYSPESFLFFSKYGERLYTEANYTNDSLLIFGSEQKGINFEILQQYPDQIFRIPHNNKIRCLNLSNSANIVLFEALKSLDYFVKFKNI